METTCESGLDAACLICVKQPLFCRLVNRAKNILQHFFQLRSVLRFERRKKSPYLRSDCRTHRFIHHSTRFILTLTLSCCGGFCLFLCFLSLSRLYHIFKKSLYDLSTLNDTLSPCKRGGSKKTYQKSTLWAVFFPFFLPQI